MSFDELLSSASLKRKARGTLTRLLRDGRVDELHIIKVQACRGCGRSGNQARPHPDHDDDCPGQKLFVDHVVVELTVTPPPRQKPRRA